MQPATLGYRTLVHRHCMKAKATLERVLGLSASLAIAMIGIRDGPIEAKKTVLCVSNCVLFLVCDVAQCCEACRYPDS